VPFLDMAANQGELGKHIAAIAAPTFEQLGLKLETFTVENLSLPDELQKRLDERISMNIVGDMRAYTQYQAAQSIPIAAANPGGMAGMGVGLGAGMGMGSAMADAMKGAMGGASPSAAPAAASAPTGATKFCMHCGKSIPAGAKFCPECGGAQA
jgi:membrane protease subunit (stomatin/prohibitin family)